MAITREQIFAVADQLDREGANPTLAKIRKQLGGGSYTTISEIMTEWKARKATRIAQAQREPLPLPLSERLEEFGGALWHTALELATTRYSADREALEQARTELSAEKSEAVNLADQVTGELERLQERAQTQAAALGEKEIENEELRRKLLAMTERAVQGEARGEELAHRVSDLNAELARVNEQNHNLVAALTVVVREPHAGERAEPGPSEGQEPAGHVPEKRAKR